MLRYCKNCQKEYDFSPLAVSGRQDLICPACGNVIDKNSRHPVNAENSEIELGLGRSVAGLFRMAYVFYLILGMIGAVSYVIGMNKLLYFVTAVSLIAFIIQFVTGFLNFHSGLVLIPAGAIIGYLCFKTIEGACLGIHIVFLIRHLLRDVVFGLIFKLVKMGQ